MQLWFMLSKIMRGVSIVWVKGLIIVFPTMTTATPLCSSFCIPLFGATWGFGRVPLEGKRDIWIIKLLVRSGTLKHKIIHSFFVFWACWSHGPSVQYSWFNAMGKSLNVLKVWNNAIRCRSDLLNIQYRHGHHNSSQFFSREFHQSGKLHRQDAYNSRKVHSFLMVVFQ